LRPTPFPKELTYILIFAGFFLALFGVSGQNCAEPITGNCSPIYYLLDFQTLLYSGSVYYVYDYSINILGFLLLFLGSFSAGETIEHDTYPGPGSYTEWSSATWNGQTVLSLKITVIVP